MCLQLSVVIQMTVRQQACRGVRTSKFPRVDDDIIGVSFTISDELFRFPVGRGIVTASVSYLFQNYVDIYIN